MGSPFQQELTPRKMYLLASDAVNGAVPVRVQYAVASLLCYMGGLPMLSSLTSAL